MIEALILGAFAVSSALNAGLVAIVVRQQRHLFNAAAAKHFGDFRAIERETQPAPVDHRQEAAAVIAAMGDANAMPSGFDGNV